MEDKVKIPILGVTKEAKEYEKKVIKYLKDVLVQLNSNIELIDISFYDTKETTLNKAMDKIENLNKKVIFLTDSAIGNTDEYENTAKVMFEREIRPFVFVTHIESANYDLNDVVLRPTFLVEYFDIRADWYHYIYDSILFNFDTKRFLNTAEDKEEDINIFIEAIKQYIND